MYRSLFVAMFLLFAVNPVSADAGKKLTNAELKQLTSTMLFSAGYSTEFSVSYLVTWFRNGTGGSTGTTADGGHCQEQVVAQRRHRLREKRRLGFRKVLRVAQGWRPN